jgi:hypothetical protein
MWSESLRREEWARKVAPEKHYPEPPQRKRIREARFFKMILRFV